MAEELSSSSASDQSTDSSLPTSQGDTAQQQGNTPGSATPATQDTAQTANQRDDDILDALISGDKEGAQRIAAGVTDDADGDAAAQTSDLTGTDKQGDDGLGLSDEDGHALRRWSLNDEAAQKALAALDKDQRAAFVESVRKRTEFTDTLLRENAEYKKKLGISGGTPAQDAPATQTQASAAFDEAALTKELAEEFGEGGAKAILSVSKRIAQAQGGQIQSEVQALRQAQQMQIADLEARHTESGFTEAAKTAPKGLLDNPENKAKVLAHAFELVKTKYQQTGNIHEFNFSHAIPIAVQQLFPTDHRRAAAAALATKQQNARRSTVDTARPAARSTPAAPKAGSEDELLDALMGAKTDAERQRVREGWQRQPA